MSKCIWKLFKTSDKNIKHNLQMMSSVKVQGSGEGDLKILEYVGENNSKLTTTTTIRM